MLHSQNEILFVVRYNNILDTSFELFFAVTNISLIGVSLIISRRGARLGNVSGHLSKLVLGASLIILRRQTSVR